jgi:Spy/CpxP family protein refolding chaperone
MIRRWILCSLCTAIFVAPAVAQDSQGYAGGEPSGEDRIAEALFAPDLVMQHRQRVGLTSGQWTEISDAIRELQRSIVDLEWDMLEASQGLIELLEAPQVDEAAALTQVDQVLSLERSIKRAQLGLLIRIKNILTPEQQFQLRELRGEAR